MLSLRIRNGFRCLRGAALGVIGALALGGHAVAQTPWAFSGADIYNSHSMLSPASNINLPTQINPSTASNLAVKWSITTAGGISATPTVEPGGLYVPDWAGYIYKINPATGAIIWKNQVSSYTGLYGSLSRSSPAIGTNVIVFGDDWAHDSANTSSPGARMIAVNKTTGALAWVTIVDTANWSIILGSPVIYNNIAYIGVASWEESLTTATFTPSFRGSLVALDVNTGKILWKTYMTPPGYTGVAVPGSAPMIWPATNSVIVGTGNNYTIPASVGQCIGAVFPNVAAENACMDPTNYVESLVSLDLNTGKINWARRMSGPDIYNGACFQSAPALKAKCPYGPNNDVDFASQPQITWVTGFAGTRDDLGGSATNNIMGIGQKNGNYYAVNPVNGGLYWTTSVGPAIEWGSALNGDDGSAAYVPINNFLHQVYTVKGVPGGSPLTTNAGSWSSINIKTGAINWQIRTVGQDLANPTFPGASPGAMSFSNRVVFGSSSSGVFAAMDAYTGAVLWQYPTGLNVGGAPAIFNETVYWGAGVRAVGTTVPTLYAFAVPG